jgi:hypothetical protein
MNNYEQKLKCLVLFHSYGFSILLEPVYWSLQLPLRDRHLVGTKPEGSGPSSNLLVFLLVFLSEGVIAGKSKRYY